jgi:hypothetical protein
MSLLSQVRFPVTWHPWMRIGTRRPVGSRTSIYARIDQLYGTIPAVPSIYDACQPDRRVNNDRAALPLPFERAATASSELQSPPTIGIGSNPTNREYWVTDSTDLSHTSASGRGGNTRLNVISFGGSSVAIHSASTPNA